MKITLRKYAQEGNLANEYNALRNIVDSEGQILPFDTDELAMDLTHPLQIDCQPSYDGTVNLIINDDKNPPRIINSRFTKIEGERYRIITRNQRKQTNLYEVGKIDQQTRLFRTLNTIPKAQLYDIGYHGQLAAGNYVFYVKFGDEDNNKTDIMAETGVISIFFGTEGMPKTVRGGYYNERTNKNIKLLLKNVDTSFSNIYLYYSRSTCDMNGGRTEEFFEFREPFEITGSEMKINISGFEDVNPITRDDINIKYLSANAVKTQAQVQNRLFFGNIEADNPNNVELQQLSYYVKIECTDEPITNSILGFVDYDYKSSSKSSTNGEYYNAQNLYYRLGYWPEEIYRLGIVYIMNDDTRSPVYNLRGCDFSKTNGTNLSENRAEWFENDGFKTVPKENFLNLAKFENTYGVFKNIDAPVIREENTVQPIYYKASFCNELLAELKKLKVKGFFLVRQRRIPTTIAQGLEIGINKNCWVPMLWDGKKYIAESFKSDTGVLTTNIGSRLLSSKEKQSSGLLCLDAMLTPSLQSAFSGLNFVVKEFANTKIAKSGRKYKYMIAKRNEDEMKGSFSPKLIYIQEQCTSKVIDDFGFSTRAGSETSVSEIQFWDKPERSVYLSKNPKLVRGLYSPFIGTNMNLKNGRIYNIKVAGYNENFQKEYFDVRGNDNSPFFPITDRYSIYDEVDENTVIPAFRGDCFINTATIRINRNFTDPDVPICDFIIDENTWKDNYKGYYGAIYTNGRSGSGDQQVDALRNIAEAIVGASEDKDEKNVTKFYKMNRADVNSVPLGMWATYKCLSNYNLSLRSIDAGNATEYALLGNPRSFYPLTGASLKSAYKMAESTALNTGYNKTVGDRFNTKYEDLPYIKDQFDNRIMFSNLQVNDQFKNSYRIFQGLSYQDVDRQYGGIVKIIPWYAGGSGNLLCVFEHGIGIVPINEKALVNTTLNQSIHFYGTGVIGRDVTVVSDETGSTWPESIIKTPLAIYGVDTYTKKIWKMPLGGSGFETISDMTMQSFLNDFITFKEADKTPIIALRNVKTHYNDYKGDIMFTFYDYEHNTEWNICYNERTKIWTTRYSWTPLFSENINNQYYSFDKKRAEVLSLIGLNRNTELGLKTENNVYDGNDFSTELELVGYHSFKDFIIETESIRVVYYDEGFKETTFDYKSKVELSNNDQWTISSNILDYNIDKEILYYVVNMNVTPRRWDDKTNTWIVLPPFKECIAIKSDKPGDSETHDRNGVYLHGRAGVHDEINYFDENKENNIQPTKWYDRQEPFEIEFVVTQPTGLHKIFDNLVIISNNVKPNSFEFEIEGDVFDFNKAGLYWKDHSDEDKEFDETYNKKKFTTVNNFEYQTSQKFDNVKIKWDHRLDTYSLNVSQNSKDIKEVGRMRGNIHYKEDSWKYSIEPIKYIPKYKVDNTVFESKETKEARIRDKFCKVRIKYTGEDLVIITAIKTLVTLSYS